jgi:hypothetical protein
MPSRVSAIFAAASPSPLPSAARISATAYLQILASIIVFVGPGTATSARVSFTEAAA